MNGLKLGVPGSDDLGFRFQVDAAVFHGLLADHVEFIPSEREASNWPLGID